MARKKKYDDDGLVQAIAQGERSYAEIGRQFGLSDVTVWQIAHGRVRPELLPRILAARETFDDAARRTARPFARAAVARLAKLLAAETTPTAEVQRKVAMDIIELARKPAGGPPPELPPPEGAPLGYADVTDPELRARLNAHRGGPHSGKRDHGAARQLSEHP